MIRLRAGLVRAVLDERPGLVELSVEVEGAEARAVAYPDLTGPVAPGDRVQLNTTAVDLALGTGGVHFVLAVEGQRDLDPPPEGHVMKLRYTPLQVKVRAAEEQGGPDREAVAGSAGLAGLPVIWAPLHSMVGAATAGALAAGAERVVHVMTDGGALPAAFSRQLHELRATGLLDAVVTAGQAFGGDHEAVNLFSGLLVAKEVAGAEVVVVADGPGKVGTGTTWGTSDVAGGLALVAAHVLGGRPVATLRLNFADPDYRHYGVSPHSLTVLREVAVIPVHVAVPALDDEERRVVWNALRGAGLEDRHQLVEATGQPALELLEARGVSADTMGWTLAEEPAFFLAAGAAGTLAGRMAVQDRHWRPEPA
ncbi:MAG TPA: DUF3866 family protein, partial [Actinomycetota bacterium]|nr:DUF3866 family protein [Actinomycetota bacterium]